jgi:hypothetical protein
MTKSKLLILFLIISCASFGQKKIKPVFNDEKQEVTIEGQYYIGLKKTSGGNLGMAKNFSVLNKAGDQLIFMKFTPRTNSDNETSYWYEVSFPESGSWLWVSKSIAGISTKGAIKFMIKNELIKDGELDWEMTKRYLQNNNGKIGRPKSWEPSALQVSIVDNEIIQDGQLIGKVIEKHTETDRIYHVYDVSGAKVMVARIEKQDPMEWTLTSAEGKTYTVLYEGEQDGIKILTYMASKGWLRS